MKKLFYTVFFFLVFYSHLAGAYDSYQTFKSSPVSLNLDLEYYKTEANFNADGNRESLLSGYTFQNMNLTPHLRWQFGNDLAFIGGLNIGNSESNDNAFTRKNSIINRIDLAAEYLFISEVWLRLFARFNYSMPLEKLDINGDTVLTSNAASEINPEVVLNMDFEDGVYTFVKGGLSIRGEGLSTLGTYGFGTEFRFSDFGVGAAILGKLSIKNDSETQRVAYRDNFNNRVEAGSKIFNSVNPNSHDLEANFNFLMGKKSLFKIYAGVNLLGSNISSGYYGGVNINWVFDWISAINQSRPSHIKSKSADPVFKENTNDGVNQDYFKPVAPVSHDYIQQIEGSQKSLQEATTPDQEETITTKKVIKKTKDYKIKLRKVKKNEG